MEQQSQLSLTREIIRQLHLAGQFLHFRMGGKAGRRRVLTVLLAHPVLRQKELQEQLRIQAGSMSEIIAKMEADGLLQKEKSKTDNRNFIITLTPAGVAEAQEYKRQYEEQIRQMMDCFSYEQKEELCELLITMMQHWNALEKRGQIVTEGVPHPSNHHEM